MKTSNKQVFNFQRGSFIFFKAFIIIFRLSGKTGTLESGTLIIK